jgi:hypothetical protein
VGQWNRGTIRRPAGLIAASVDITISPAFLTNTNVFFQPSIASTISGGAVSGGGAVCLEDNVWSIIPVGTATWTPVHVCDAVAPTVTTEAILLENGEELLLEDGEFLLLEAA